MSIHVDTEVPASIRSQPGEGEIAEHGSGDAAEGMNTADAIAQAGWRRASEQASAADIALTVADEKKKHINDLISWGGLSAFPWLADVKIETTISTWTYNGSMEPAHVLLIPRDDVDFMQFHSTFSGGDLPAN